MGNISLKIFHFNGLLSYYEQYILVLKAVGKTRGDGMSDRENINRPLIELEIGIH